MLTASHRGIVNSVIKMAKVRASISNQPCTTTKTNTKRQTSSLDILRGEEQLSLHESEGRLGMTPYYLTMYRCGPYHIISLERV